MAETQISAYISESTKELLERYAEAHGLKKGFLIEEAVLHHVQALRELPANLIIPPQLVVTEASFDAVTERIQRPRKPTAAMKALMAPKIGTAPRRGAKRAKASR